MDIPKVLSKIGISIYHTTKSTFSSGSDWVAIGGMTQVYSDQLQTTAGSNFFEIVLDQIFHYKIQII